jgi:hypothetical protein
MADLLRGPHHCVAIATSVAERIFHFMKTRAEAHGGNFSVADLNILHAQFLASLPKAAHFFEEMDRQYMEASGSTAPERLSRDTILATLLCACSHKAARTAFPQVERIGATWLDQLFGGVARYVREHICADADDRLTRAYFEVAGKRGARLLVTDLLGDESTQRILRECLAPLVARDAVDRLTESLCDTINAHIAGKRGIGKADPSKITEGELKKFLSFLPPQLVIAFSAQAAA